MPRPTERLLSHLRRAAGTARAAVERAVSTAVIQGPKRAFVAFYRSRRAEGRPIYVDELPGARELEDWEKRENGPPVPPGPELQRRPFKSRIMRQGRYPALPDILRYRTPPLSGLTLAGVGEAAPRRAPKFFHAGYRHIYGAIEQAFHLVTDAHSMGKVPKVRWDNRRATGPVAPERRAVDDPAAMSAELKAKALEFGAALAGCAPVVEEALYDHVESHLPHAIVVAVPMDRTGTLQEPSAEGDATVIEAYYRVGRAANSLAEYVRSLGWQAEADTNLGGAPSKVLHVPLAVAAGLGEMGRHTSVITPEYGSNVRLATVMTDVPLAFDGPVDIGVEAMCADCTVCAQNCPADAIYEEKQVVRGVEKWHIDFDRCMPYFVENEGCGVCQTVCPWAETGKAPLISMLQRQRARVREHYPDPVPEPDWLVALGPVAPDGGALDDVQPEDRWIETVVARRTDHPGGVVELVLEAPDGSPLPDWSAGAHVETRLPSGRVRAYSLANGLAPDAGYRLAVKVEEDGTGGSLEVAGLREQQRLVLNRPGNNYLLREDHERYYLCAGGIGVTPMVPTARRLRELGRPFEVHYSVKDRDQAIYADELDVLSDGHLHVHTDRDWLEALFDGRPDGSGVCVCGPRGFMDAVQERAVESGLPAGVVYREDFGSAHEDRPFDLVLASSGERVRIEPGQTIARELGKRGVYVPVSCGYGICGTCTVGVLEGEPDARDKVFSEAEKKEKIALCCSRSLTDELVIDL